MRSRAILKVERIQRVSVDSEAEKASLEKCLYEFPRERDEARAQAKDLKTKYEDLQAVYDGLIKSKSDLSHQYDTDVATLKSSLEESEQRSQDLRAQLDSSQPLLADSEKQLEQLSLRQSLEVVIERFKEGQNFPDLLIDNTVSNMKTFCLKDHDKFPGIHSMFPEFVGEHFGEEYVVPLTDGEDDEDGNGEDVPHNGDQSDDALSEDEEDAWPFSLIFYLYFVNILFLGLAFSVSDITM
ncbi:hypothetical protein LIER_16080 [Lithospermum erythrorhizon]|uniref:Uncharacterized protein n=1 Tax=Lithospermum erythrorhizon TaxID=34254 RepID=A0AAV3Q585_LITER